MVCGCVGCCAHMANLPASIEEHWRGDGSAEADAGENGDTLPFFVLAGLMGGERTGRLPSHAGSSIPRRFEAPIVGHGRSGLFLADQIYDQSPPIAAGPSIPVPLHHQMPPRPDSAPASKARPSYSSGSRRPTSAATRRSGWQPPLQPQPQRRSLQNEFPFSSPPLEDEAVLEAVMRKRAAASRSSVPPLQTLDRVLQKELAYGRLGFPTGHYRAPSNQMPADFTAALMRERGRSKLKDVTMIPTTLRSWESTVERRIAGQAPAHRAAPHRPGSAAAGRSSGAVGRSGAATRAAAGGGDSSSAASAAAPPEPPPAPATLTPYEMRKFLQHSQRYFMAVRREPFNGAEVGRADSKERVRRR